MARFEHMPGHLLRRCHQIAGAIFLDECELLELTPLQFAVLDSLLHEGPQDQVTLAGAAALDRTTISLVIRKLEARGLVRRAKSAQDQRANIVKITAVGKKLCRRALPAIEAAQQRIVEPLNGEETETLLRLLEKLSAGNNRYSRAPAKTQRRKAAPASIRSRTSTPGRAASKP
jgi:MarR family transcriptional regulator, lower aerobic nicotinate degradation pathway regulator